LQFITDQPCNIAGLISEVSKEVAIQLAKDCRRRQPHFHLTPPLRGTSANILIHLTFSETRVIGLHFCRRRYGSIFLAVVVSQRFEVAQNSVKFELIAVQGHPRSSILVPIEGAYATSY